MVKEQSTSNRYQESPGLQSSTPSGDPKWLIHLDSPTLSLGTKHMGSCGHRIMRLLSVLRGESGENAESETLRGPTVIGKKLL